MCLTTFVLPKTAKEDIVVYKILKQISFNKKPLYTTLFMQVNVKLNDTLYPDIKNGYNRHFNMSNLFIRRISNNKKFLITLLEFIKVFIDESYEIDEGYIHSVCSIQSAYNFMYRPEESNNVIVEAIIPKGSKYYIGNDGDYCSDKLFITDKIVMKWK